MRTAVAAFVILSITSMTFGDAGANFVFTDDEAVELFVDSSYEEAAENGDETHPFKTISAAVQRSKVESDTNGRSVRIRVKPGVGYRESVEIGPLSSNATQVVLSLEAYDEEQPPTISGADAWLGDSFGVAAPNREHSVYFHPWEGPQFGEQIDYWADYGFHLPDGLRRRESIRLGDFPLRRVLAYTELVPGCFYLNEVVGESGFGNVFVCPPIGISMNSKTTFEVARRASVVNINQRNNVILKNLSIQDAADYFEGGLQVHRCRDIKVDSCSFAYCCSYGANVTHSTSVSFIANRFYKNGIKGLGGAYVKDMLVRGGNANLNNWRGAYEKMEQWDSAGIKFFQIHDSRFEQVAMIGNSGESMGLWLDTDVENVVISNVRSSHNHYGFFYEASRGPCRVENCEFTDNSIGVYSSAADKLSIRDSLLANNDGEGQFVVFGHSHEGGRTFRNFETNRSFRVQGNGFEFWNNRIFWDRNSEWKPLISARGIDIEAYRRFQATFRGGGNVYRHGFSKEVFLDGQNQGFCSFEDWKTQLTTGESHDSVFLREGIDAKSR